MNLMDALRFLIRPFHICLIFRVICKIWNDYLPDRLCTKTFIFTVKRQMNFTFSQMNNTISNGSKQTTEQKFYPTRVSATTLHWLLSNVTTLHWPVSNVLKMRKEVKKKDVKKKRYIY